MALKRQPGNWQSISTDQRSRNGIDCLFIVRCDTARNQLKVTLLKLNGEEIRLYCMFVELFLTNCWHEFITELLNHFICFFTLHYLKHFCGKSALLWKLKSLGPTRTSRAPSSTKAFTLVVILYMIAEERLKFHWSTSVFVLVMAMLVAAVTERLTCGDNCLF